MSTNDQTGVHETHCCKKHGCKYGDVDCPVFFGTHKGIICEFCEHDETISDLALLTLEDMIKEKRLVVTCNYFGSPYRGIVTEMVTRPDGRIHLIAHDPRMIGEEKFK